LLYEDWSALQPPPSIPSMFLSISAIQTFLELFFFSRVFKDPHIVVPGLLTSTSSFDCLPRTLCLLP